MPLLDDIVNASPDSAKPKRKIRIGSEPPAGVSFDGFDILEAERKAEEKWKRDNEPGSLLENLSAATKPIDTIFDQKASPLITSESVLGDLLSRAKSGDRSLPSGAAADILTQDATTRRNLALRQRRNLAAEGLRRGELTLGEDIIRAGGDYKDVRAPYKIETEDGNTLEDIKRRNNEPAQPGTLQFTQELLSESESGGGAIDQKLHALAATDPFGAALAKGIVGATLDNPITKTAQMIAGTTPTAEEQQNVGDLHNISTGSEGLDAVAGAAGNIAGALPVIKALVPLTGGMGPAMVAQNIPTRVEQFESGQAAEAIVGAGLDLIGGEAIPAIIQGSVNKAGQVAKTALGQQIVAGGLNIAGQTATGVAQQLLENPQSSNEDIATSVGTNILLSLFDTKARVKANRVMPDAATFDALGDVAITGIGLHENRLDDPTKLAGKTKVEGPETKYGRAQGAFQMLPGNVRTYTKKALGKSLNNSQFRKLPYEDQYKVARAMSDEILQKHLLETDGDAAEAIRRTAAEWFGGPNGVKNYLKGRNPSDGHDNTANYIEKVMGHVERLVGENGDVIRHQAEQTPTVEEIPATQTPLTVKEGDLIGERRVVATDREANIAMLDDGTKMNADQINIAASPKAEEAKVEPKVEPTQPEPRTPTPELPKVGDKVRSPKTGVEAAVMNVDPAGRTRLTTGEVIEPDAPIENKTQLAAEIDTKAHEAATSPENNLPEPTIEQKKTGDYKMGHIEVAGFDVAIENPRGSVRSGVDADGKPWEVEMKDHYGFFKKTEGADGDAVDTFVGEDPTSKKVFVVDQVNIADEAKPFDEHKVILGTNSLREAEDLYVRNYSDNARERIAAITETTPDEFKSWLASDETTKPFAERTTDEPTAEIPAAEVARVDAPALGDDRGAQTPEVAEGKLTSAEPIAEAEAPKEKKRSARWRRAELKKTQLNRQPGDIRDALLQYFARGGDISTEFTKRELGVKGRNQEFGTLTRAHLHRVDGPGWERVAEHIMQAYPELSRGSWDPTRQEMVYDISDEWRNEIIDVLSSVTASPKTGMLEELASRDPYLQEQKQFEREELKRVVGRPDLSDTDFASVERMNEAFDLGGDDIEVPPMLLRFMDDEGRVDMDSFGSYLRSQTVGKDFEDVPLPDEIYEQFDDFTRYLTSESAGFTPEDVRAVLSPFTNQPRSEGERPSSESPQPKTRSRGTAKPKPGGSPDGGARKKAEPTSEGSLADGAERDPVVRLDQKKAELKAVTEEKSEGKRPALVTASVELIPKQTKEYVPVGKYEINEPQHRGANSMLHSYFNKLKAYLLADGVGTGKTREILVAAKEIFDASGKPVLIVAPKTVLVGGSYQADAAALKIPLDTFEFASYEEVRDKKLKNDEYAAVFFDEAHFIKNFAAQRTEAAEDINAPFRVFATATPFDKPEHAAIYLARISDMSFEDMAAKLGFTVDTKKDQQGNPIYRNGEPVYELNLIRGQVTNWKEVYHNIIAMRDKAISDGAMLRRELPVWAKLETVNLELNYAERQRVEAQQDEWDEPRYALQRVAPQNNLLDHIKAPHVVDQVKELKELGYKKIVLVSNLVGDELTYLNDKQAAKRDLIPSAFSQLRRMLPKEGFKFIELSGQTKDRPAAIREFQEGDADVAMISYQTGGAGINLDDVAGDSPRAMIIITSDFSAISLDQVLGRISRLNTKSKSLVRILFATDTKADDHKRRIVENKVKLLDAIQNGYDPDANNAATNMFLDEAQFKRAAKDGVSPYRGQSFSIIPFTDVIEPGARGKKSAKDFFFVRLNSHTSSVDVREKLNNIIGANGKPLRSQFYSTKNDTGYKIGKDDYDLVVRALAPELDIAPEEIPVRDQLRDKLNAHQAVRDQNTLSMAILGFAQKKATRQGEAPKTYLESPNLRVASSDEPLWVSADPEVQAARDAARILERPTALDNFREHLDKAWNKTTREFEHVPNTKEFADFRANLLKLGKSRNTATQEVSDVLRSIYSDLQANEQKFFEDALGVRDLAEDVGRRMTNGFAKEEIKLPHKYKSVDDVMNDLASIEKTLLVNPRVANALTLERNYRMSIAGAHMDSAGDLGVHVTDMTRTDYMRHFVTSHQKERDMSTPEGLAKLTRFGWQRARGNSDADYITSYVAVMPEVMIQMIDQTAKMKFLAHVRDHYEPQVREAKAEAERRNAAGESNATYHDVLAEKGLVEWSPMDDDPHFGANTIPTSYILDAAQQGLESVNVPVEDIRRVQALGKKLKITVPIEVAKQFNDRSVTRAHTFYQKQVLGTWKRAPLLDLLGLSKYLFRQVLSDTGKAIHNPGSFTKLPQVVGDFFHVYGHKGAPSEGMMAFRGESGMHQALDMADEIHVGEDMMVLVNEFASKPFSAKSAGSLFKAIFQKFPNQAREITDNIFRYANFLEYRSQIQADIAAGGEGKPKNFGASHPEHVMAIENPDTRAFKLANDLIGDYGRVTKAGQYIARNIYPFHRWTEANFKAHMGLVANTVRDYAGAKSVAELGNTVAKSMTRQLVASPLTALRIGKLILKFNAMETALQLWNAYGPFNEDDKELPDLVTESTHTTFGPGVYMNRFSGLEDFTDIVGFTDVHHEFQKIITGQKTLEEVVGEMAEHPDKTLKKMLKRWELKWLQGFGPAQSIGEFAFGKSMFPDPTNPRPLVDPWAHLLRAFGGRTGEYIYNQARDIPQKNWYKTAMPVYLLTPQEVSLQDLTAKKYEWLAQQPDAIDAPRRDGYDAKKTAAYYYRRSLKAASEGYGDEDDIKKWTLECINAWAADFKNIKDPDVLSSLIQPKIRKKVAEMDPLAYLDAKQRGEFIKTLDPKDQHRLTESQNYIKELMELSDEYFDRKRKTIRTDIITK